MARPVYPYELHDPDFSWLIENFRENHPNFVLHENACQPLALIELVEHEKLIIPLLAKDDFEPLITPRETSGED